MNNLIRGKGGLIMGKMHTKAERAEKVKEIKAENSKKVKEVRAKKKELVLHSDWLCLLLYR